MSKARNSIVALSVSTSASRSSTPIASPSFLCQADSTPSSMVGESFGMSRIFAMVAPQAFAPCACASRRFTAATTRSGWGMQSCSSLAL